MSIKKILAIGPHPDDIELSCFGSCCKYAADGHEVHFLVMTKGEGGTNGGDRVKEAHDAAKLLSCELYIEDLPDRYISEGHDTIQVIEKYVTMVNPDIVFIPSKYDRHQDHRAVHYAALVATRMVPEIYVYESPSTTIEFKPTLFVDITPYIDLKMKAVGYHVTQEEKLYMAEQAVKSLAQYRGFDIFLNGKYIEAFEVLKCVQY